VEISSPRLISIRNTKSSHRFDRLLKRQLRHSNTTELVKIDCTVRDKQEKLTGELEGIEYNFFPPSDPHIVVDAKKFDFLSPFAEHLSSLNVHSKPESLLWNNRMIATRTLRSPCS